MIKMASFNITLPDNLLNDLSKRAIERTVSRDELIAAALINYFEHLDKADYEKSFKRAAGDLENLAISEEGISYYANQIKFR
jgi:metal-responsive CopG/Arc/MetJ family transcriptional regulator